jgi:hypothetical protein
MKSRSFVLNHKPQSARKLIFAMLESNMKIGFAKDLLHREGVPENYMNFVDETADGLMERV